MPSRNTISQANLVATLAALDRRIRDMERTVQLVNAQVTDTSGDPTYIKVTDSGLIFPWIGGDWQRADDFVEVTSSTFSAPWQHVHELSLQPEFTTVFLVTADSGTAGEIKLDISGLSSETNTVTISATQQLTLLCRWSHGLPLGLGPYVVRVLARRTSGSGNINVYAPSTPTHGGQMVDPDDDPLQVL